MMLAQIITNQEVTPDQAISVWEFRQAVEQARLKGAEQLYEGSIFEAYDDMREVTLAAVERTRRVTKASNRMLQGVPASSAATLLKGDASTEPGRSANGSSTPSQTSQLPLTPFKSRYDDDDSLAR